MNKNFIGLFAVALLLVGFVNAGSIKNLDYKDQKCLFGFCDSDRQVDDEDVIIDADTLGGKTKGQIINKAVNQANEYSDLNDDVGGGISSRGVASYLTGDSRFFEHKGFSTYLDYTDNRYAPIEFRDQMRTLLIWAEEQGFNFDDYELKCARIYGVCGKTECFPKSGVCLR